MRLNKSFSQSLVVVSSLVFLSLSAQAQPRRRNPRNPQNPQTTTPQPAATPPTPSEQPQPQAGSTESQERIAAAHLQAGEEYYQQARYEDAIREFRLAYEASPQPAYLYNLARAYEGDHQLAPAIDTYQRFLDGGSPNADAETIRTRIANLRVQLQEQQRIEEEARITQARLQEQQRLLEEERRRQQYTRVEYRQPVINTVGPIVLLVAGAALGGLSIWQGATAAGHLNEITRANNGEIPWQDSTTTALQSVSGETIAGWTLGGAAGACIVGGIIWFAVRGPGERHVIQLQPPTARYERTTPSVIPRFSVSANALSLTIGGTL